MLQKLYYRLHRMVAKPQERGEYSSGYWQDKIRSNVLHMCRAGKGRLLEIGCGEGLFLIQLAQENPQLEIYGIDNSEERLGRLLQKAAQAHVTNIKVMHQEAPHLDFPEGYFDTVVCINVFFNMESFEVVSLTLQQMKRIAKTQGRIIFDFRNASNPLLKVKYGIARYYDHTVKNLPLRTYSLSCIESVLTRLRLKVHAKVAVGFFIKFLAPVIIIEARSNED